MADMPSFMPEQHPGIYLLLIRLPKAHTVQAGSRTFALKSGWYVYTGSAMNGLSGRLARHLRTEKQRHWHIDALLEAGTVKDVQILFTTDKECECRTAAAVSSWPAALPVPDFGASDCRCGTHLHYFRECPGVNILAPEMLLGLTEIYRGLRQRYIDHAALEHEPFPTLVTCVLSLRTQDQVTETAAARLLERLRSPQDFAKAEPAEIARLIYPVGMYRQKAGQLTEIARQLLSRFDGIVPAEIDELTSLPGVGPKTANLVRSFAWHLPAVCVDTHVHRISNRWGLVRTSTPEQTEAELRRILPEKYWSETNGFLVQHGQQICRPDRPRCGICFLNRCCGYRKLLRERELLNSIPGAPPHPSLKLQKPSAAATAAPAINSPFIRPDS